MQLLILLWCMTYVLFCVQGQSTEHSSYFCAEYNFTVIFTLSSSPNSAWEPSANCSLTLCSVNSNRTCLSPSTPCFDYRTVNNISYCAPGSLCSILDPCDVVTGNCTSNAFVCVINSCCTPQAVCLPQAWTSLCCPGGANCCPGDTGSSGGGGGCPGGNNCCPAGTNCCSGPGGNNCCPAGTNCCPGPGGNNCCPAGTNCCPGGCCSEPP